jgi:eukaryotic-like serine/threonine-protein kinase
MPTDMDTVATERHGTAVYCPVEMVTDGFVSPTADVYALALIVGEMMTGKLVYDGLSMAQAVKAVVTDDLRPQLDDWVPLDLRELLEKAWSTDRSTRPTAKVFARQIKRVASCLD